MLSIYKECHLNLALCHIKLCNFEQAIDILSALLYYEPYNIKAFYLRGKSYQVTREYENAINDYK